MAGHRWLVPPTRGLLLCILALQLCLQDSLATAAHNRAASTMVMATKNTSAATKNTSAATKNALLGVVTTKKASLVPVTTKNTSVATQNAAVVAVTKNAMVVATTKKAAVVATANTSVATKNTSVIVKATKNTSVVAMATKNISATTKNAVVMVTTTEALMATKNTSVVATATKNTLAATKNTLTATKNALMVVTTLMATKNTSVVVKATKNALAASKNTSVVAMATKNTSAATKNTLTATKNALMVVTTKEALMATKNTSVVAATNNASVVATNTSMKGAEETMQTCQSFQCSGERCYQDEAQANRTTTCQNETYCELYRFSSTNYTAGCSGGCAEPCRTKGSGSRQQCALECCAGPLCLQLNATAYGDLPPTTTTVPLTTTSATPRPPPQNGKVCAAFSCQGEECFKGRKTITRCILGQDFCEMKKMGLNYMAGCSKACKAAKPVCAGGMKAACFQECCPATPKASCLKLDGRVHLSSAGQVTLASLSKVMACGVVLLLNYRVSTSLWG